MGWHSLLAIALGLVALVACSTSTGPGPTARENQTPVGQAQATTAAPAATVTATPTETTGSTAAEPQQGGTLVRLFRDPPTLDPHLTTDTASAAIVLEVFSGLVTLDRNLEIVPDLAERWEISDDGRVYTFYLRPDARFHDGKPVTAEDVRWSLERAANPDTRSPVSDVYLGDIVGVDQKLRGEASSIQGVKVLDPRTIQITIDEPKSYFLAKLTYPTSFVLDRENVEDSAQDWLRQPNGTGPFKLDKYDIGQVLRLVRNEDYYLGAPYLDAVEFILSGGTAMLMYENGEIHLTGVGLADLDRVLDPSSPLNPEVRQAPPSFRVDYIGLNVNEPPLDDPKVRQALNLAINKDEIASVALRGLVVPAKGILPPGFPGYSEEVTGYPYDPERARQLLQESKYGGQLDNLPPIIMTTQGSFGATVGLDLEAILQMWQTNLGIRVEIQQTEFATYLQDLHARRFQVFQAGWIADYPDPQNFLEILFHSDSDNNHTNYSNPEVDSLLDRAAVERDTETRFQLYNQAEQMILDDAPWVPLWYSGEQYVLIKPKVKDYYLFPLVVPKLRYVYFDQ